MEKPTSSESLGCGSSQSSEITLNIQTTTGGNFSITVENNYTVDQLKKIISKKLKVPKDRICLLHRERQLRDGLLKDNGLMDGSRVILLPSVETGLLTQRPESSVMQALESLNDSQVNDFLSGKSPLNLTMRLGDHMMLIQLQLSTLNPISNTLAGLSAVRTAASGSKQRTFLSPPRPSNKDSPTADTEDDSIMHPKSPSSAPIDTEIAEPPTAASTSKMENTSLDPPNNITAKKEESSISNCGNKATSSPVKSADDLKSFLRKQDIETLQNAFEIFKSLAEMQEDMDKDSDDSINDSNDQSQSSSTNYSFATENSTVDSSNSSSADISFEEQSPIKSLSNLVSSPLKTSLQSNYAPVSTPLSEPEGCIEMEDKPPPSVVVPSKFVPLPSSLKNNLIESLVEIDPDQNKAAAMNPVITDPIAANLTSCLCSKLNPDYNCSTNCHSTGHAISKEDNPHKILMETDVNDDDLLLQGDACSKSHSGNSNLNELLLENSEIIPDMVCKIEPNKEAASVQTSNPHDVSETSKNKRLHYLLHKTSKNSNINKQKAFMQSLVSKHLKKKMQQNPSTSGNINPKILTQPSTSTRNDFSHSGYLSNHFENLSEPSTSHCSKETSVFRVPTAPVPKKVEKPPLLSASASDTKALIEASKNLTQTLKKLSKEVLTSKVDLTNEENARAKIGQGAVIESMKHHGKGIYSGTFSGTLNPALQDRFGRPKRDISTIIHILNDLLCATPPQYRRGARITFEPTHTSTSDSSARTKQRDSRHQRHAAGRECTGQSCSCSKCSGVCPYGECDGHYPVPPSSRCSCGSSAPSNKCRTCSHKDERSDCERCHTANALALDNSKTKCKLDNLRMIMRQKKQRREMRKMKAAPYSAGGSTSVPAEAAPLIAEEIETLA